MKLIIIILLLIFLIRDISSARLYDSLETISSNIWAIFSNYKVLDKTFEIRTEKYLFTLSNIIIIFTPQPKRFEQAQIIAYFNETVSLTSNLTISSMKEQRVWYKSIVSMELLYLFICTRLASNYNIYIEDMFAQPNSLTIGDVNLFEFTLFKTDWKDFKLELENKFNEVFVYYLKERVYYYYPQSDPEYFWRRLLNALKHHSHYTLPNELFNEIKSIAIFWCDFKKQNNEYRNFSMKINIITKEYYKYELMANIPHVILSEEVLFFDTKSWEISLTLSLKDELAEALWYILDNEYRQMILLYN